ncbi:MAG: MMPL family transporter [Proteobacteria bacterium]|nr:MMPL family transporter [Pseudomonadota bacterium]
MSGRALRLGAPGGLPIGLALAGALLAAVLAFARADIRTDMLALLPQGDSAAARLMLAEAGGGPAARMILAGIDGAPPARLAAISAAMGTALRGTGLFDEVRNGQGAVANGPEAAFLFAHRYLLSPGLDAAAFEEPALRDSMRTVLRALRSSAAPLASQFGLADPQGAFLKAAGAWIGESRVRMRDGVWFAPDTDRAVMLLMTRSGGMDVAGQDASVAAIRAAFAAAEPGPARLVLGGPAVFAQQAAGTIRADAMLVSIGSVVLVVGLLLWRFRSPWAIAAALVPVALGVAAALAAVQAAFGFVHGVALGFGMTMLGVTADYPVLLIGHRKQGEAPPATFRRIGRAFALAVAAALLGLTGMLFSGLSGLAQIGLFAASGLAAAALATRFLLPPLIVAADLAPVALPGPARLRRIERLRA